MRSKCEGWQGPRCAHVEYRDENDHGNLPAYPWCTKFNCTPSDAHNESKCGKARNHYQPATEERTNDGY